MRMDARSFAFKPLRYPQATIETTVAATPFRRTPGKWRYRQPTFGKYRPGNPRLNEHTKKGRVPCGLPCPANVLALEFVGDRPGGLPDRSSYFPAQNSVFM
jgi:hypothetical protein